MNSKRRTTAVIHAALGVLSATSFLACATSREAQPTAAPAAISAPAPAAPADYKNTVRWSTASEVDNFGYDVYRADTADGPWARINASPILGAGTTDEVQKYSYVDRDIDPTRGYFYYVESISLGGVREKFTPVIAAKPKLAAAPGP